MQNAFYTLKDHTESFQNRADARLINPTKTQIGKVSKIFLENAINLVKAKTGLNLLKNTQAAITWFKSIQNKDRYNFIQFDVNSFYPNILKKLLVNSINFARQFTEISNLQKKVILQSCRSLLVNDGIPWMKKGDDSNSTKF